MKYMVRRQKYLQGLVKKASFFSCKKNFRVVVINKQFQKLTLPRIICKAPRLVFFPSIVFRIAAIVMPSHQFNSIETVTVQRQMPRFTRAPTLSDGNRAPIIGTVFTKTRMGLNKMIDSGHS